MSVTHHRSPLIAAATLVEALAGHAPPVIIDCRFRLDAPDAGVAAWRQERLPGAYHGDLESDFSGPVLPGRSGRHPLPTPAVFSARMRRFGVGSNTEVVFYDDSGGAFAARAWWLMCHAGHPGARVLDGGLGAWRAAGGALDTGPPPAPPSPAEAWPSRPALVEAVTVEDVLAALGGPTPLVDARACARFEGKEEPIDPVAGHIPGACCLPHTGNLDADGTFLAPAALAARWSSVGDTRPICYCGSGVTAAHNVLAAVVAGLAPPRLYPGSWSEWITDPGRPVAAGPA